MNHVDLNTVSEVVRQVILSFSAGGTVFELDGRAVACLIPPPIQDDEGEWTAAENARRFYLIDKEIDGSITREEAVELEKLQAHMGRWLDKVAPLPMEHVRQLHRELLEAANRKAADEIP
jgi:hypothetical protein